MRMAVDSVDQAVWWASVAGPCAAGTSGPFWPQALRPQTITANKAMRRKRERGAFKMRVNMRVAL